MTLDDAAAVLDITEKSVVRLIREGKLHALYLYLVKRGRLRGRWEVNGADVRKRRRRLMLGVK